MAEQLPDHVYGVIIEVEGDSLILPNSAVVEVLGQDALKPVSGGPNWLLGRVDVEFDQVPVISLEALWGRPIPARIRRSRVVVLKAPGREDRVAVMARSYPLIVTLNEVAVRVAANSEPRPQVLSQVQVANRAAVIPDLDELVRTALAAS